MFQDTRFEARAWLNTTSVWGVIRAGKYINRTELDQMMETVRKRVNGA